MKTVQVPSLAGSTVLPQTLPQSVLDFSRSLHNITVPVNVPMPGVVDPPRPFIR